MFAWGEDSSATSASFSSITPASVTVGVERDLVGPQLAREIRGALRRWANVSGEEDAAVAASCDALSDPEVELIPACPGIVRLPAGSDSAFYLSLRVQVGGGGGGGAGAAIA